MHIRVRMGFALLVAVGACGGGGGGDDAGAIDTGVPDASSVDAGSLVTENCPDTYGPGLIAGTFDVAGTGEGFDLDGAADPDGDGMVDNSIGEGDALRGVVNNSLGDSVADGTLRLLAEMRDFDGLGGDDAAIIVAAYGGVDSDDPAAIADDFNGDEDFYYSHSSVNLDDCIPKTLLDGDYLDGVVDVSSPSIGFEIESLGGFLTIARARYQGTLETDTEGVRTPAAAPGLLGGAITQCSLNRAPGQITAFSLQYEITQLFGIQPDIDLDGDGLETVQTVAQEGVISCTDGDGTTVVEGADCGCDPRFADGYSIAFVINFRGATVLGPEPAP